MIRWLVVLLVLANIVFFAVMQWGGKQGGAASQSQAEAALNPDKIRLLNTPLAAVPAVEQSSAPVAASAVTAVPAQAAAPEPAATVAHPAPAVVAPPAMLPAAPTPVHAAPAPASAPVSATRVEAVCLEWGEFSGTDLARADKALAALKLGDKLGQRTVEYNRGYLVYLAPFKTPAGRAKKVRELKDAGVSDYFVIKESGKLKNAISLGVFKTEEAAKHYRVELGKKGLKSVQIGPREAKLKFTVFTFKRVDTATATQLGAWQKDYPGSELKSLACQPATK